MSPSDHGKPTPQERNLDETRGNPRNRFPVFLALFAFRLINAYFVQTFFQPDEYFQSLEPAWDIAFGPDSGAWLTWVGTQPQSPQIRVSNETI